MLYGCCGKVDCMSGGYFKFRLLNKVDSTDLVFCNNKKYLTNNILLYSKYNTGIDTVYKSIFYNYGIQTCDSTMTAFFYKPYEKIYIRLDSNTVDSLELKYNYFRNKCCGDGFAITSLKYNNNTVRKDSTDTYNIYK